MHESSEAMTLDNFRKVLDFQAKSNISDVRILGGEPTIHPKFNEFIKEAQNRKSVGAIHLFTNGLFKRDVLKALKQASKYVKISVLINYNEPKLLGEEKVSLIESNISALTEFAQVTLGINFYDPEQEYQYIIESTIEHKLSKIRYAVTIPNTIQKAQEDISDYFKSFTPLLVKFFGVIALKKIGITADCNNTPICMWDDDQLRLLSMVALPALKLNLCNPVIDVKVNLEVIRCFGVSDHAMTIDNFDNVQEIHNYFINKIDRVLDKTDLFDECSHCAIKEVQGKSCGCLVYKKALSSYKDDNAAGVDSLHAVKID